MEACSIPHVETGWTAVGTCKQVQHEIEVAAQRDTNLEFLASTVNALAQVLISVGSVPDTPEIVLPTHPVVQEDGELVVSGLGVYDADVSRPGDEDLLFDVWLEAVSGRFSLNRSTVRMSKAHICGRVYEKSRDYVDMEHLGWLGRMHGGCRQVSEVKVMGGLNVWQHVAAPQSLCSWAGKRHPKVDTTKYLYNPSATDLNSSNDRHSDQLSAKGAFVQRGAGDFQSFRVLHGNSRGPKRSCWAAQIYT